VVWHLKTKTSKLSFVGIMFKLAYRGGSRGGCTRCAPPLKLEKIWFFGVKSWFFTRNTPKMFAPPSARCNFFKCAPLTWNPGSAPGLSISQQTQSDIFHTKMLQNALWCHITWSKCMLCNILEYCSQTLDIHGHQVLQLIFFFFMTL
jgi:hypothetical protein